MPSNDFQQRVAALQAKQAKGGMHETVDAVDAGPVQPRRVAPKPRGLSQLLLVLAVGLLGVFAQSVISFTGANYEQLKLDHAAMPGFVNTVYGLTALSFLAFAVFVLLGLSMLRFQRGRRRNAAVPAFFIGVAIGAIATRAAAV